MFKKLTIIMVTLVFMGAATIGSAQSLREKWEGKLDQKINEYCDLTRRDVVKYYEHATGDKFKDYKFHVCNTFIQMMANRDTYPRKVVRAISIHAGRGNYKRALFLSSFMREVFIDIGNQKAANQMEKKLRYVIRAAKDKYNISKIKDFIGNISNFYRDHIDLPEKIKK